MAKKGGASLRFSTILYIYIYIYIYIIYIYYIYIYIYVDSPPLHSQGLSCPDVEKVLREGTRTLPKLVAELPTLLVAPSSTEVLGKA